MFDLAHQFGAVRRVTGEQTISAAPDGQQQPLFLTSFAEAVLLNPGRLAVAHGPRKLTYQDLDRRAASCAARLRDWGIRPGNAVAVSIPSSLDAIVAVLGVFKVGAICVPLDPDRPAAIVDQALDVLRPRLVLTGPVLSRSAGQIAAGDASALGTSPAISADERSVGERVAYAFEAPAADGSRRRITVTHAKLAVRLAAARAVYGFQPHHVLCCQGNTASETVLLEMLSALTSGASVRLVEGHHRSRALAGAVIRALARSSTLARPLRRTTPMVRRSDRYPAGRPQHRPIVTVPLHAEQRSEPQDRHAVVSSRREGTTGSSLGFGPADRHRAGLKAPARLSGMLRRPRLSGVAKLFLRVFGRADQSVPRREVSA